MPGVTDNGNSGGSTMAPRVEAGLLANSQSFYGGDLVVQFNSGSGADTLTRRLATADVSANYANTGLICGVFGLCTDPLVTNTSGVVTGNSNAIYLGSITLALPAEAAGFYQDGPSGRSNCKVIVATPQQIYYARLNINTTDLGSSALVLDATYSNRSAQLGTETVSGVTMYSVRAGAQASTDPIEIIGILSTDPLYGTSITPVNAYSATPSTFVNTNSGPMVAFRFKSTYCQSNTGNNYAS